MMWFLTFFLVFMGVNKDTIFICENFNLESFNYSLLALAPFMIYLSVEAVHSYFLKNTRFLSSLLIFFLILFMSIAFMAGDFFCYLIFLEMSIMPIIFLILVFSKGEDKIFSAWSMFFFNIFGSGPFMILVGVMWRYSLQIPSIFTYSLLSDLNFFMIFLFLPLLCFKIPIFLSHFWLTKAHVSAAGFCSMILASLSLKLGSFGILKFIFFFKNSSMKIATSSLGWGLSGLIFFTLFMIRFVDVKYYVAVSSLVHMSFILPACVFSKMSGCFGSLLMMVAHGVISPFFFLLITLIYELVNSRTLDISKALESFSKVLAFILIFTLLMNLGIPPFMGFFSELEILKIFLAVSKFSAMVFVVGMIANITHFMFMCSKMIYNKKFVLVSGQMSFQVIPMFMYFIFLLILTLFFF